MTEPESWMKKGVEIKSNGYVYPGRVLNIMKNTNECHVEIVLPNNMGVFRMKVDKSLVLPRTHYNPIFDTAKVEKTKREEFLYPIGSKVLLSSSGAIGTITKYSPDTGLYCIEVIFNNNTVVFKTYLPEKGITLVDKPHTPETFAEKRKEAEDQKHEVLFGNAKDEVKVEEAASTECTQFNEGDRVLVMVNEYHGKKNWMPNATIIKMDKDHIFQPARGHRWFIRFDHSNILWSYPEDRLKIDESFYGKKEEDKPAAKNKYRFEIEDRVRISSYESVYAGDTGKIIGLSLDKPDYFQVKLDNNGAARVFPSYMLKHVEEDKVKPEKEEEPKKSQEEEVIDLMTGFVTSMFNAAELPVDFKKFKEQIGKVQEMFKK